jgi:hypothetical protein
MSSKSNARIRKYMSHLRLGFNGNQINGLIELIGIV